MKKEICNVGYVLSLLSVTAIAQQTPASAMSTPQDSAPAASAPAKEPTLLFTSSAEVAERIAKADAAARAGIRSARASSLVVSWGPFHGQLAYRGSPDSMFFVNEDSAQLFVVLEGAGTMVLGGTLVNPTRTGPHLEAHTAAGGVTYQLVKGDTVMVPPGAVHSLTRVEGRLVYMTMHLPLPAGTPSGAAAAATLGR